MQETQHRLAAVPQPQREVLPRASFPVPPPLRLQCWQRQLGLGIGQRLRDHLGVAPLGPLLQRRPWLAVLT